MKIGIDFDNTLVCYDGIFHRVACELNLISEDIPINKNAVRDYLRSAGKEESWTEMQGIVYGTRMEGAAPFSDAISVVGSFIAAGHEVFIISHKTKTPYRGEPYDLHEQAKRWLIVNRFFDDLGLKRDNVFFEVTKDDKLNRVKDCGCDWFIDDLPEILTHPLFPPTTNAVLFDPRSEHSPDKRWVTVDSWGQLQRMLLSLMQ